MKIRSVDKLFPDLAKRRKDGQCPLCGKVVDQAAFTDELSRREFAISGTCQPCQDILFKEEENENDEEEEPEGVCAQCAGKGSHEYADQDGGSWWPCQQCGGTGEDPMATLGKGCFACESPVPHFCPHGLPVCIVEAYRLEEEGCQACDDEMRRAHGQDHAPGRN